MPEGSSTATFGSADGECHLLIVEPNQKPRLLLSRAFTKAGYAVLEVASATTAREVLEHLRPDVVLLRWEESFAVRPLLDKIRKTSVLRDLPVVVISSRVRADRASEVFEAGADDFVSWPHSVAEIVARVRARLRRSACCGGERDLIQAGRIALHVSAQRVSVDGQEVQMAPIEFRILTHFVYNADRAHTRAELCADIWGKAANVGIRTIDVHVRRLRRALEPYRCEGMIQTVFGSGYRFSTFGSDRPPRYTRAGRQAPVASTS